MFWQKNKLINELNHINDVNDVIVSSRSNKVLILMYEMVTVLPALFCSLSEIQHTTFPSAVGSD